MKAIRHAGITVIDLRKALRFYEGLLGFKIIKRMEERGGFIDKILGLKNVKVTTVKMAADDKNLIELVRYHSHRQASRRNKKQIYAAGLSHIAFTVKDLNADYKRLKRLGVKFNSPPQISPDGYAKVAFCRDPEGNFIEMVESLEGR